LDQIAHVRVSPSINRKLISREIIFALYVITVPERHSTDRQIDRQTDRQTDR